jgi:serine/threonine-protein kinase HipA
MAYIPVNAIEVRCWGRSVGAVALDDASGFYAFEFSPEWADSAIELAPLQMPTQSGPFIFPNLAPATFHRLPALLADALPDDFGNALTTAYLENEGVPAGRITALDRLAYLGQRALGALEFRPTRGPRTRTSTAIQLSELVLAARSALSGDLGTEHGISDALSHLIAVGTSAGGARAKAVVAINFETNQVRSGQVAADPGFAHWLLKFDGVGARSGAGLPGGYGRIEYAYFLMARAASIDMMDCRLLCETDRAHFITRRFDRPLDGTKVHVQTLCSLGHLDFRQIGTHSYAQLFRVIDELDLGPDARAEAFRRMVFNVAAANCDDHTKNTSFVLPEGGRWALAPAYDLTYAYDPGSPWVRQHLMSVNGKTAEISRSDLAAVGDRFEVPGASRLIGEVLAAIDAWPDFAASADIPTETMAIIGSHIGEWSSRLR